MYGKTRKRGMSFGHYGFSQILSEAANLAKDAIALQEKMVTIVMSSCAFRLMNLLLVPQTVKALLSRRMNSARMTWRTVSTVKGKLPDACGINILHLSSVDLDQQAHDGDIIGPDDELGSSDQVEVIERKKERKRRKRQSMSACILQVAG